MRYQENLVSENGLKLVPRSSVEAFASLQYGESELNELFAASMPRLARTARRFIRNHEDSEDVLQESLLSAFRHFDQFKGRSSFYTWMYSIVRNHATMHLRKGYVRRCSSIEEHTSEKGEGFLEGGVDPNPDVEETCAAKERSRILWYVLMSVPRAHQEVIQACDIEGLNCKDAAARLGITLSGLKTRLHRARKLLSKRIRERCASSGEKIAKNGGIAGSPKLVYGSEKACTHGCQGIASRRTSAKMRMKSRGLRHGPKFRNQGYQYVGVDGRLGLGGSYCTAELG